MDSFSYLQVERQSMYTPNQSTLPTQRKEGQLGTILNKQGAYVPVCDAALFAILRREIGLIALRQNVQNLFVFVDSTTATEMENFSAIVQQAQKVVVIADGHAVPTYPMEKPVYYVLSASLHHSDRILLLLSSTISIALLSEGVDVEEGQGFNGGWTVERSTIDCLARGLLNGQAEMYLPDIQSNSDAAEDAASSAIMHLATLHAGTLTSRVQSTAVERNDLLSVLQILQEISAKRQIHDILFAFVYQISRSIPSDRCSIVRVLRGDNEAEVIVSHENENLRDYRIKLDRYPELTAAAASGEMVIIDDVSQHPLTQAVSPMLLGAGIAALVVLPVVCDEEHSGRLILRVARRSGGFIPREISFLQIVTETAANALERAHLFESIQEANDRLEQLAITDSLTGLYNRRYFHDRFEHEFERACRYRLPFSCVLFDIDNFKEVNDTCGHLVGDSVLKEVAQCMIACTRRVDILARYGGEEFVILLPQTNLQGAAVEAERMRSVIEKHSFPEVPKERNITISVGVAGLDSATMKESSDLLRAADTVLYEAKNRGKNCVVVYGNP